MRGRSRISKQGSEGFGVIGVDDCKKFQRSQSVDAISYTVRLGWPEDVRSFRILSSMATQTYSASFRVGSSAKMPSHKVIETSRENSRVNKSRIQRLCGSREKETDPKISHVLRLMIYAGYL